MTIKNSTLYAIYSHVYGFYLGENKFGRAKFLEESEWDAGIILYPEDTGLEHLTIINDQRKRSGESTLFLLPVDVACTFNIPELCGQDSSSDFYKEPYFITLTSRTLYSIYSDSRGFYLGVDKYGRHEFTRKPEYNYYNRPLLLPEKEAREILGIIGDSEVRLVEAEIAVNFNP